MARNYNFNIDLETLERLIASNTTIPDPKLTKFLKLANLKSFIYFNANLNDIYAKRIFSVNELNPDPADVEALFERKSIKVFSMLSAYLMKNDQSANHLWNAFKNKISDWNKDELFRQYVEPLLSDDQLFDWRQELSNAIGAEKRNDLEEMLISYFQKNCNRSRIIQSFFF